MEKKKRPESASTTSSRTSAMIRRSGTATSLSLHSQHSSLEDILVKEYMDKISRPSSSASVLPRKYISPYAKTTLISTKGKKRSRQPPLGLHTCPQSSVVAGRSRPHDCSRHQTKSVQSSDGTSDSDSSKSSGTNNSSLIPHSKRNRPVSAPAGQRRYQQLCPSSESLRSQKRFDPPSVLQQQPWIIRVRAYKNGSSDVAVKVVAPNIDMLLEECTEKLKLNTAARRVFLVDGTEALEPKDIPHDADVYISTGEPFIDPFKKMKAHLSLAKEVNWTINGIVFPSYGKCGKTKPSHAEYTRMPSENSTIRILVFRNGTGQTAYEVIASVTQLEKFLDACTQKLGLTSPARYLYNAQGKRIEDLSLVPLLDNCLQNSITPLRGPAWVSKGEGFSPCGVKAYIQGVLWALHQRMKPSKEYSKQLNFALDGLSEKVTQKEILSMSIDELYQEQENVDSLIDDLRATIKKHKDQLSKLAMYLQAEEEQRASYIYQHIKELPAKHTLQQGLQLRVFQNGEETGDIYVYINRNEMKKGCENDLKVMMDRLLQMVHQRLQCSSGYCPSGLNLTPTRLFDKQGQDIKNPLLLQNEQKVWVSYGEDYRAPANKALALCFDRVIAVMEDGVQVVYKTVMDTDMQMPYDHNRWEACLSFPESCHNEVHGAYHCQGRMDTNRHFLQNKDNPQMVLYASVTMEQRSARTAVTNKEQKENRNSAAWPLTHVWLITKAGMILSRALPQVCLAVDEHPVQFRTDNNMALEGYKLAVQSRMKNNPSQQWAFGNNGHIYSMAYPEFLLTCLEEFNAKEEVTQTENHNHFGAWTTAHQETDSSSTEEVLQTEASSSADKQLSGPFAANQMPEGSLMDSAPVTVALLRKLEEKDPKASAQRWAIKHEGTSKPRQWKHSKVENPLWNKLTYMWPVLPNGELNEDFEWPIEGSLISNSPPMKKLCSKKIEYVPVRLKVLKNGDCELSRAVIVTGPDITNMLEKHRNKICRTKKLKETKADKDILDEENHVMKTYSVEFLQFLERCTLILGLPFAARRMFDENGKEITLLKGLQRDQLVYVSCGKEWIDPQLSVAEKKKRLLINNLTSDITLIRNYCAIRSTEGLVIEVVGKLIAGAKLALAHCAVPSEPDTTDSSHQEEDEEEQERKRQNEEKLQKYFSEHLDSHTKSHITTDALHPKVKYSWQQDEICTHEEGKAAEGKENELLNNTEPSQKYRPHLKITKVQQIHRQQFEFQNGYIVNCRFPSLVLGVESCELHTGADVILMVKRPDDINQRWILTEEERTVHLMSNPGLVLAVSLPKIKPDDIVNTTQILGSPIVLQNYKEYSYGAANQKWFWIPKIKIFSAYYATVMDQEITAANHASICTFSVAGTEDLDQPGYYFASSNTKETIMLCPACSRSMRGKAVLKMLPRDVAFSCATGKTTAEVTTLGPFKYLNVSKVDLSTSEAEHTLLYYEEILLSLKKDISAQTASDEISASKTQRAVKIIAYKNGAACHNGELIVATTFPMLLYLCTRRLGLSWPATKLYTIDGTAILSVSELMAWAVNDFIKEKDAKDVEAEQTESESTNKEDSGVIQTEDENKASPQVLPQVTANDLKAMDEELLSSVLRNPIEVWASCGEAFIPLDVLQKRHQLTKKKWLEKGKILSDLEFKKHRIRQLQGQRFKALEPANIMPTKSIIQPAVVEGGWIHPSKEEEILIEDIHNMERHLSEMQTHQMEKQLKNPHKHVSSRKSLYAQPTVKRLLVYLNGTDAQHGTYVWATTMEELLNSCTSRLNMRSPAQLLYTSDGKQIALWEQVERDMSLVVSAGEPFMTNKASKQKVEVRANYARARKQHGPDATDIVISFKRNPKVKVAAPSPFLTLPSSENLT